MTTNSLDTYARQMREWEQRGSNGERPEPPKIPSDLFDTYLGKLLLALEQCGTAHPSSPSFAWYGANQGRAEKELIDAAIRWNADRLENLRTDPDFIWKVIADAFDAIRKKEEWIDIVFCRGQRSNADRIPIIVDAERLRGMRDSDLSRLRAWLDAETMDRERS